MVLAFEQQAKERSLRTATTALPFEQQTKESAKAFAAFRAYLEMGPKRSFARVVQDLGVNRKSVLAWSKRFD